jgi:Leucine-rich repeat (LRR) protein
LRGFFILYLLQIPIMRKLYPLLAFLCFIASNAQIINIPDANFKAKLLSAAPSNTIAYSPGIGYVKIDTNNDGEIQLTESQLITSIDVSNSNIASLNGIDAFSNLTGLICSQNQLTSLDISYLGNLTYLDCSYNTLSNMIYNSALVYFNCRNNQLTGINLYNLMDLQVLNCASNQINSLDLLFNTSLTHLTCWNNQLSSLNLLYLSNLVEVSCSGNQLTELVLYGMTGLQILNCDNNLLASLNLESLGSLQSLNCSANLLSTLNLSPASGLQTLYCSNNQISSIFLFGLSNLQNLNCSHNLLTNLELSSLSNLQILNCSSNSLSNLNLSPVGNLQSLNAEFNQLSSINLTQNSNLIQLILYHNLLNTLSVESLTNLSRLGIGENNLVTINTDNLTNLSTFECYHCEELTNVNFQNNTHLSMVTLIYTSLTTLDLSHQQSNIPMQLAVNDNPMLHSINVKNGYSEANFAFYNCPNLEYICADDAEIVNVQNSISSYGYSNCHVNTYCSFTPGSIFYSLQGINRYDSDSNGCGGTDVLYPGMKLNISNGTETSVLVPDNSGNYHYDVSEGSYTIIPVLENPQYFTVSPPADIISFPTQASPHNRNFCISRNGYHNDLEVSLIPLGNARPGFDAKYRITIKNKGTEPRWGTVTLNFAGSVSELVFAVPVATTAVANTMTWDFMSLAPFESRNIDVVMNLNSPVESPPLNNGDVLNYTVTIWGFDEETPADNTSVFNQVLANSLDPNDKTCLEGSTISPDMIGQYLHYMIRFENTGTANAENIVVKDMIDTSKFDIASLIPLSGSHPFITKITDTNKVEFIFQNINLPFDDANNDGYVAFKIKTKPTLVVGDTFSNTANIYFDYNFPIVTNTATTAIQLLGTPDFEFSKYFILYPNPVKNTLNIQAKTEIEIKSAQIYNMLGQLVQAVTNMENTSSIDVSQLKAGNYFIKVNSGNGNAVSKFIKE